MRIRVWALVALLFCSSAAMAQECPLPAGASPGLAHIDPASRLEFLRLSLTRDARLAQRWRWGWVAGFGFLTAFNLGNAVNSGVGLETQSADYVGAGASALSIIPLVVHPLKVIKDGPAFDSKARGASPAQLCGLVQEGERLLAADAESEASGTNWTVQLASIVINVGAAAIIGLRYHSWSSAAITGGVGLVLGETMIQTQPTGLVKDLQHYQAGAFSTLPASKELGFSIHVTGTGISGTF